uniref:Uncharacterized protein n=1 Tax=Anguilla anguilla TaxID=7936 RepID=A0A0E9PSK4_ANGAN
MSLRTALIPSGIRGSVFFSSFWPATSKQSLLTGQWISACVVNLWPAPHSQSCELHHPRTALHCTPVHSTYC